ncbi:hypothetical protein DRP04_09215, partial [Archaeoglobales archaeon]
MKSSCDDRSQKERAVDWKDILIASIFFLVAFSIRVAGVSNIVILWDEWLYQLRVYEILANGWIPSAAVFEGPSPLFSYLGAVVTIFFGGELDTLRMLSVVFGSLTVPFIYLFGKTIYDRNTGLLAAFFLCFSAYHCMYSRVIMLEAFTIFFVTAFLYFFCLSQRFEGTKSKVYAVIAGVMLGLAIDAKYLPAFLAPAVLAYKLWYERSIKKLITDVKIILVIVVALLLFVPMLVCFYITGTNPLDFYVTMKYGKSTGSVKGVEQFEKGVGGGKTISVSLPFVLIFSRGVDKMAEILSWGSSALVPLWGSLFELSSILIFFIVIIYYLYISLKRDREGSFLMASMIVLVIFLI